MEEDEGSDSGVSGMQKNKNNVIESSDDESDGSESESKESRLARFIGMSCSVTNRYTPCF